MSQGAQERLLFGRTNCSQKYADTEVSPPIFFTSSYFLLVFSMCSMGQFDYKHLKIPRKPAWTREMTAEEIDRQEKEAFLLWRREIAVGH
jgi:hypothetical protein